MRNRSSSIDELLSSDVIHMPESRAIKISERLRDKKRFKDLDKFIDAIKSGRILIEDKNGNIIGGAKPRSRDDSVHPVSISPISPPPVPMPPPPASTSMIPVSGASEIPNDAIKVKLRGFFPVPVSDWEEVGSGNIVRWFRKSDGKFIIGGTVLKCNKESRLFVIKPFAGKAFGVKWDNIKALWKKIQNGAEIKRIESAREKGMKRIDNNQLIIAKQLQAANREIERLKAELAKK